MTMKTILLIEDDLSIRGGLRDALQLEHYQVLTASDGGAAIILRGMRKSI